MSVTSEITELELLGYGQFFEDSRVKLGASINCLARVTAEHKGVYEIISLSGEERAVVEGKRMLTAVSRDDYPAVGDWVVINDSPSDVRVIEDILPRQTTLRKKQNGKDMAQLMVANVDVVFIVASMDRDYNINRVERYLVLAGEGGVRPVIVLNKADLLAEAELALRVEELHTRFSDVAIVCSSTVSKAGLEGISSYIKPGTTYCFVGSSGVGKSSVITALIHQAIKTKAVGLKTGRGMHTTTARQMYFTDDGGIIIDNPGSREVGIVNFNTPGVEVFDDIEIISKSCRFTNCSHASEAGCAVLAAIKSGDIGASHYENYLKLQKEAEHNEMSKYDKRKKDKKFGKFVKNAKADIKKFKSR